MKKVLQCFLKGVSLCAAVAGLQGCSTGVPEGIQPVEGFDVQRYMGVWHEVARLDHAFERGYDQITAEYRQERGSKISVHNRASRSEDGKCREVKGYAKLADKQGRGHLKVSFWRPFYASYVVFYLEPDYSVALVCGASRKYCWILARDPNMPTHVLDRYLAIAESYGFEREAFIFRNAA